MSELVLKMRKRLRKKQRKKIIRNKNHEMYLQKDNDLAFNAFDDKCR